MSIPIAFEPHAHSFAAWVSSFFLSLLSFEKGETNKEEAHGRLCNDHTLRSATPYRLAIDAIMWKEKRTFEGGGRSRQRRSCGCFVLYCVL